MMSNKEIINERFKGLVQNWGESAQLLSFNEVIELMELAQKEAIKEPLKVVKKVVSEGYKLKQQHFNKDWRNALEDAEELIIKNKK